MPSTVEFRPPARFQILRQVGAGGMGVVYEAIDANSGGRVALKTLAAMEPGRVMAFKDEFRSLAVFSHPNVATLYELLSGEDRWFISMEFIEGVSFLEYLCASRLDEKSADGTGTGPPLNDDTLTLANVSDATVTGAAGATGPGAVAASPVRLRETARQLAEAVMALHVAGILHRDLKPSNVLITPDGRVFVLDFGLAERLDLKGESSQEKVSGTIQYMAPEQAAGETLSAAADWYAVGVMLYQALSGRCPFDGPPSNILWDKQRLDPPPLDAAAVALDADLAALCMELVRRDPSQRPHGAEVISRLGGSAASAPSSPKRAAFVGRESQLATLRAAFDEAGRGKTRVALIVGKSGMGKSALVGHFLAELTGHADPLVLAGRCYEKESLPFKAFDSIVDSLARYLAHRSTAEVNRVLPRGVSALSQVFPVLNQVGAISAATERNPVKDARELRQRAFGALRELLVRLGDLRRLVVYIDDVQWGDGDSAALLRHILQPPDAPEILLIAACREEYAEKGELLSELLSQPDCVRVPVGPLTSEEARRLAADLYGADQEKAERIARESGGSPYFVQELREDAEEGDGSLASLDAVLYQRVAALPASARQLVEIAAVSGHPVREGDACKAAGLTGEDQRMLAMLRAQRLIRGASGQIETYHDRVREAVVAHLDASALKRHHFALATTLEASGTDAEAIAEHFAGAGESARAAPHYVRAAERASGALAFDHAAKLLSRAAELSNDTGEQRRLLLVKLANALANAGRGVEAARYYHEAARGAPHVDVFELERKEAYWFAASGHVDEGGDALRKMLERVGLNVPGPSLVIPAFLFAELRLLFHGIRLEERPRDQVRQADLDRLDVCWDAIRGFSMIDPPVGICVVTRNLLLALRVGDAARAARMLIFYSIGAASTDGSFGRSHVPRILALAAHLVDRSNRAYLQGFLAQGRAMVAMIEGRWTESANHFQNAEEVFSQQCTGVAWELASTGVFFLWVLVYAGRYAELRRRAAVLHQEGSERGDLYLATSVGCGPQSVGELMAGRADEAMALLEESLRQWTRKYSLQAATAAYIRAWIHLYRGEGVKAFEVLNHEWPALKKHHYLRLSGVRQWLYFTRAQSALAVGLFRAAERDAKQLERDVMPFAHILAKVVRAGCASKRGDRPAAQRLLEEAARDLAAGDMTMMAAAARRRLGELTGNAGLIEEADRAMNAEGVPDPERVARVFMNGF